MAKKDTNKSIVKTDSFDDAVEVVEGDEEIAAETGIAKYSSTPIMDASDLYIPRLRLAQGLTQEVQNGLAKPGDWLVLGGDPIASPTIIPMMMTRRRELRDPNERGVLCRSSDSIHGIGDPGGECGKCPLAKWPENKGNKGKKSGPPCTFFYSYIVYVVDTAELAVLEFYRTSIPAGKMLNTMISQKGLGKFGVKLSATGKQGPKGTYYTPQVGASKITAKDLADARERTGEVF